MENTILEKLNKKKEMIDKLERNCLIAETRLKDYRNAYAKEKDALCELCGLPPKSKESEIADSIRKEEAELQKLFEELEKTIPDNVLEKFVALSPEELEDEKALNGLDLNQDF